jgi:hypothetical protein
VLVGAVLVFEVLVGEVLVREVLVGAAAAGPELVTGAPVVEAAGADDEVLVPVEAGRTRAIGAPETGRAVGPSGIQ